MSAFLLLLTLVFKGIVKTADGNPAANVRAVAMIPPDLPQDIAGIASMAALTESDENRRFRLENVPAGSYLIAAGRIDAQTYYPGYLDVAKASKILVTEGNSASGINFVLNDSSGGRTYNSASFTSVRRCASGISDGELRRQVGRNCRMKDFSILRQMIEYKSGDR